jgi:flagellar hook assembly protein FlgD
VTLTWDLKDGAGAEVPDDTYTVRMEMAEDNSTQPAQNNQGTFTFIKGAAPEMQTGLTNGGFDNVSIMYTPKP